MKAICVGELLIDFIPDEKEGCYIRNPGGAPANVAVALSRAGIKTGFVGKLGNDYFGDFLMDVMAQEGVEMLCKQRSSEATTTMVFVSLTKEGERSFTFVRKPGADMLLDVADIDAVNLNQACVVHAGSVSMSCGPARAATLHALQTARELGKLVCFDVNYRDTIWGLDTEEAVRVIRAAFPYVDLLKMSEEELELFCPDGNAAALLQPYGLTALVITRGEKGCDCYTAGGVLHAPSVPRPAVDTTGAGDAFWGNFLASLLRDGVETPAQITASALEKAMQYGNRAGAYCVQRKGAIPSMPYLAELEKE